MTTINAKLEELDHLIKDIEKLTAMADNQWHGKTRELSMETATWARMGRVPDAVIATYEGGMLSWANSIQEHLSAARSAAEDARRVFGSFEHCVHALKAKVRTSRER